MEIASTSSLAQQSLRIADSNTRADRNRQVEESDDQRQTTAANSSQPVEQRAGETQPEGSAAANGSQNPDTEANAGSNVVQDERGSQLDVTV